MLQVELQQTAEPRAGIWTRDLLCRCSNWNPFSSPTDGPKIGCVSR